MLSNFHLKKGNRDLVSIVLMAVVDKSGTGSAATWSRGMPHDSVQRDQGRCAPISAEVAVVDSTRPGHCLPTCRNSAFVQRSLDS